MQSQLFCSVLKSGQSEERVAISLLIQCVQRLLFSRACLVWLQSQTGVLEGGGYRVKQGY